jgi:hypothetical protein
MTMSGSEELALLSLIEAGGGLFYAARSVSKVVLVYMSSMWLGKTTNDKNKFKVMDV